MNMKSGKLAGRVALVSGGSRGIGGAIVEAFAREGADVAFSHYKDDENASRLAERVSALGRKVLQRHCDIADLDDSCALVAEITAALGPINILVNNAGINENRPFEEISVDDFDRMLGIHLRGSFFLTQTCYRGMIERGWGRIINITSQLAYKGGENLAHYCAAKGALSAFTRALALEAAPRGVLVNAIAPGPVETALLGKLSEAWRSQKLAELPIRRFAAPEEIAPTAVLLASEDGSYYVGATLCPAGGDVML